MSCTVDTTTNTHGKESINLNPQSLGNRKAVALHTNRVKSFSEACCEQHTLHFYSWTDGSICIKRNYRCMPVIRTTLKHYDHSSSILTLPVLKGCFTCFHSLDAKLYRQNLRDTHLPTDKADSHGKGHGSNPAGTLQHFTEIRFNARTSTSTRELIVQGHIQFWISQVE